MTPPRRDRAAGAPLNPDLQRSLRRAVQVGVLVFLRPPVEADRGEFVALRQSSKRHLARWEPLPQPGFDPFGDDAFERELRFHRRKDSRRLLICRRADGAIVGRIGLGAIIRGDLQQCFIGYWIGKRHTGKGYMTEALCLAIQYAFETLGLHRVEVNIQPDNFASRRVAEKAGLRLEGYSLRYLRIGGRWADHERWAVTREEWPPEATA
ncbi:MAG: GNAT family N-acetyltransferase [Phycisphaeraceae bacterium]|nr:GNAT family N-acetyltransferase [Phycisphaeraceae bacterium]MCW5753143.1 GNAT family N-acetyltransferase [Phycisphaeraceae bacterium]